MAKTLTKQELKAPDEFVTFGTKAMAFAQKNIAIVVIAALLPLLAVAGVFAMNYQNAQREIEAAGKLYAGEAKMTSGKGIQGFKIPGISDATPDQLKEALTVFASVEKEYPGTKAERRAHLLAGEAQLQLKDYDAAIHEYEQANGGTDVERYAALNGKAHALEAKKAWDDAASVYKSIVDDTSLLNRDIAALDLARVDVTAGKADAAKTILQKYPTDFPNSPLRTAAETRLTELGGAPAAAPDASAAPSPEVN